MQVAQDQIVKKVLARQPYPMLFASVVGSHLYGFPSFDSDHDIRGAHILPLENVVGLYNERETLELMESVDGEKIDFVSHDVHKYFTLLLKRNTNVLEQIYSPLIHHRTAYFDELREIAGECLTSNHGHAYRGFAQKIWAVFEKQRKLKPLLYVFRTLLTGLNLMETGEVEANIMRLNHRYRLPYLGDLIALKLHGSEETLMEDADMSFYEGEFRRLMRRLDDARFHSDLPEEPRGKPELHDLLVRMRLEHGQAG
ncbi:nucleotidyltransferase [Lujinxingia vulgaris]|uniref:Nucleotidyltransferase n=2 Tax=Lujinxingia vulgaris TaxID=2600176 RepID=A0A5C6X2N1_9DELT|nr:nucleotidyltransferase [Lujinxingia vulgaris]